MDIKAYIQSGIIEQYILGLTTAEEAAELEQLRIQYTEINDAVLNFEITFEQHLLNNPVQPPSFLKSSLQQQLFNKSEDTAILKEDAAPVYKIGALKYLAA